MEIFPECRNDLHHKPLMTHDRPAAQPSADQPADQRISGSAMAAEQRVSRWISGSADKQIGVLSGCLLVFEIFAGVHAQEQLEARSLRIAADHLKRAFAFCFGQICWLPKCFPTR